MSRHKRDYKYLYAFYINCAIVMFEYFLFQSTFPQNAFDKGNKFFFNKRPHSKSRTNILDVNLPPVES